MLNNMSPSTGILAKTVLVEGSSWNAIPRLPFLFSLMAWHLSEISQRAERGEERQRRGREESTGGGTNERRLIYSMARGRLFGFSYTSTGAVKLHPPVGDDSVATFHFLSI